jgi:hypothetical protein
MIASTNDLFSLFFVAKLAMQSEINSLDLGNQTCLSTIHDPEVQTVTRVIGFHLSFKDERLLHLSSKDERLFHLSSKDERLFHLSSEDER